MNPLFAPFVVQLKDQLRAPLRLPTLVRYGLSGKLYAELGEHSKSVYEIVLSDKPDCRNLPLCVVGRIRSQPSDAPYDTSTKDLERSRKVTLADATRAIVGISTYRGMPTITWIERSRRYVIELYVRSYPADLVATANSMSEF